MDKKQIKPSFKSYFYLQENSIKNKDIIYDLILKLKYENPSEIQIKIIKSLEKEEYKKDRVSCSIIKAETGTGKTLAYLIELLQSIDFSKENEIQGLIITPTRELALQTEEYINKIINLKYKILIGGKANIPGKIKKEKIDRNNVPTIIVGTLGKLREVLLKKHKNKLKNKRDNLLSNIKCIIVDEADKMISQNKPPNNLFESFLKYLLQYLFKNNENNIYKQFILCSASLDDKTELFYTNLISNYINKDRNEIFKYFKTENVINEKDENDEKIVNDNIKEYNIIFYNKKHESIYEQKYKILIIILSSLQKKYNQCLIFYNKKNKGEELSQDLRNYGFSTCFIHGELNQDERQLIFSKIKNLEYKIILSTDLLSRGIDLTAVNLVINFDEAFDNIEHYHRIGRTGRFFEQGIVISFYGNKNDNKEILKNKNNYNENEIENVIKIIENEFILSERLSKEEIEKINKGENKNNNNILKEALTEINGVNILLQKKRKLQFEKESLIKEDINQKDEENDKRKSEKNDKLERNEIKDNILINERINNKKKHFCLYCNFMKIFDV